MNKGRKLCVATVLALVLLVAFGATASPPPLPSSFYGSIASSGFSIPAGTRVSAWIGGVKLAEAPVFSADGGTAFVIDVPGDIPDTAAVEGGHEGEAIVFKVSGAPAPETASWHTGSYQRRDLTVSAGADLSVSVDDGATTVIPGAPLSYTLTVRNLGTQKATGVVLTDLLPSTVTVDSAPGASVQTGSVTWPAFDLDPGAVATRTVDVFVNTTLPVGTTEIVNSAKVSHDGSQGIDPNPANDAADDHDTLLLRPDFSIEDADLTATPSRPAPGNTVNVSLVVHNTGFASATGSVVAYNGLPFSSSVIGTRTVTLAAGASQTVTFSFVAGASTVLVSAVADPNNQVTEINEGNNTARRFLADVPDLAVGIDNVLLSPSAPRAGDAVAVNVTVRNGGRLAASSVPVEVFDGEPEVGAPSIYSGTLSTVPAGGNQAVSFTWTATEGQHELTVVVDRANAILEMSETNNRATREVVVRRAAGPDLTVSAIDLSGFTQSAVTLTAGGTVQATIANVGDSAVASPFTARLFEDRDGDGRFSTGDRELARQTLPAGLAAGGSTTASFAVSGTLEFFHPVLWVEADADGQVPELREDNNFSACFGGCEPPPPASPGVAPTVEKWRLSDMEIETAPVVVQLTDDNGDGKIDSRDVPDIVFHAEDATGALVTARSGADGSQIWTFRSTAADPLSSRLAHLAAADLDGDGVAEIIASERNGRLLALDHNGQKLWVSDVIEGPTWRWQAGPSVGDLNGDGVPEIVVGRTVLSNTGKFIAKGTADIGQNYWYYAPYGWPLHGRADAQAYSIIADVDLDGRNEIVAGGTLYRLQGNQLVTVWERELPDHLMPDGFTAVGNLDADPQAEIVYVSSGQVMVLNHDGTIAVPNRFVIPPSPLVQPNGWSGPPTIADLDGDGVPEILVAGATQLVAMHANLTTYWRAPINDVDAQTAATVFDLDGDGKPEVLYNDQDNFYILNGQTGAVLYSRHNTSKTAQEYPVVADVDNDGQAEIVIPSDTSFDGNDASTRGLHVLGNPGWRGTRPIWNQYSYHVTNVQLDGTVPAQETPSWQASNTYRVNESQPRVAHRRPNATIGLPRVGAAASGGAPIRLRVGNGGRGVLPAGVAVTLYAGDPSANVVAAKTQTTVALQPGGWQDLLVSWQVPGPSGAPATAVVDPAGVVEECDETDNSVAFQVTQTVLPDLSVPAGGVTVPASPVAGQKVAVSVRVDNLGSAPSAATVIRLYDGPPALGVRLGEAPLASVAGGASVTVPVTWDTLGAAGTHAVYAFVDADDVIVELDEGNNQGSVLAALGNATKPDPAAERLVVDPPSATVGTPVRLALDVADRGAALAGNVVVAFRLNNAEVARVTAAGPWAAGETRTVEYQLSTLSLTGLQQVEARIDPDNAIAEQNETNNSQTGTLQLTGAGATVTVTTERVSYRSNDTATITVKVQNSTAAASTLGVKVTVQNASGGVIATVANQSASYPPGATSTPYTWGTGATPAGTYAVVAEVSQNGTVIARGSSPFSIQGDRSASAQIFGDRGQYEPTQSAALSGLVTNTGVNQSLTNLQAKVTVASPAGATVFTATQGISLLSPGAQAPVAAVWPIANAAPGVYTARIEVRDNGGAGALLAFASAGLTVLDTSQTGAGLSGSVTVSPETIGAGSPLLARFSARNGGNADVPALRLRLRLERSADGVTVASQEIPWPLSRNQQKDGSLGLSTAGFAEGGYMAVLEALLPGGDLTLGRDSFTVVRGVSVADARVSEGDAGTTPMVFTITLSSAAPDPVTVAWATADGTAVAGQDYQAASGTVTFAPGETQKTVSADVLGDTAPESEEVFLLTLSNASGALLGDSQALGVIADEEGCPSPDLLADGGAEEGAAESDLPGWTATSGAWSRRFADPVPLDGLASLAAGGSGAAELRQDVDLSPYAARIDAGGQQLLFEGFVQSAAAAAPDGARVVVEYRDAANAAVLASFDSGEVASAGVWKAVVDARAVPAGTRWARVRLLGADHGDPGLGVFFDRLGLRSLGVPALTVTGPSVTEGNTGTTAARFTLQLSCPAPSSLAVSYATADGTAVAGSDYAAASGTVTFDAGTTSRTVDVAVQGDTVDEPDETFFLDVTAGSGLVVLDPRTAATIADDDGPVTLSAADAYVDEGNSGTVQAQFTVSLSSPSGKTVKVSYATVAGTAAAGQDFTATSGTLTFAPGVTSLTVSVPVIGDRVDEADETFTLHLSSPVNASTAVADATGTILDDDQAALSIADAAVLEGNGEAVSLVFPVTLSTPADRQVRVNYATVDGTAVAGTDYQATSGTLTFAPGATTASISVPVLGNRTVQTDRVLRVQLSAPQVAVLADPEAEGTIRDDDGVLINLGSDVTVKEGASASLTVTVTNNNQQTVTVDYSTVNGTAVAPGDFTAVSGTLSFPPGTSLRTITVPVANDSVEEPLIETFQVKLSHPNVGTIQRAAATVTIADDDGWALNGPDARLDTVPGCILVANTFLTRGSAWKKQAIDLTRSFDQTYQVYLGANDAGADGMTFTLQSTGLTALGTAGGGLGFQGITPSVAVEMDTFQNSWDPVTYDHMAVDLNGDLTHQGVAPIPVTPDTANVEDGKRHDLRLIWNATAKVLDVHFDGAERLLYSKDLIGQIFGGNPTVFFGLTAGGGSVTNDHYFCPTIQCADPTQPPLVSVGDVRVPEGNSGTTSMVFPVTLSCPSAQPVTVTYATADGTARAGSDYAATSGTLTFQPGETSKDVVVPVFGDVEPEPDETLTLNLSNPLNGALRYAQGNGTILHDDAGIQVSPTRITEGSAASDYYVEIVLNAPFTVPVSFNWQTADGTAVAGSDYTAASGALTFQPGETRKTIKLRLLGDTTPEADETFSLRFTNVVNATIPASVDLTIVNDDDCQGQNLLVNPGAESALVNGEVPGWTEALGTSWTRDNGGGVVPSLSGFFFRAFKEPVAELRQDVDVSSYASVIAAGLQRFLLEGWIETYAGDSVQDLSRIVVEFRDATNTNVLAAWDTGNLQSPNVWRRLGDVLAAPPGTAWVRVRLIATRAPGATDNVDAFFDSLVLRAYATPELSVNDVSVAEGSSGTGKATFTVTQLCPNGQTVKVDYLTADGTAQAGTDYQAVFGALTFAPGETTKTVDVPVLGDVLSEGNETFFFRLASSVNAGISRPQGTGTIQDDESVATIANISVFEGSSGQTPAVFTVTLSKASTLPITIDWTTVDGTAIAGSDYVAASGTLSFAPGQTSKTISVAVLGDTVIEPDETFSVRLSNPTLVTLGVSQAVCTIVQDDLTVSIDDAAVLEGNTGTVPAVFTVTLSQPSTQTVTVAYKTEDRTATAGQDYTAVNGTLSFAPGETVKTITVQVKGDTVAETGELFTVVLSNPVGVSILKGEGVGTIADDDDCPSPTLLKNPGNEDALVNNEIPGWTEVVGTGWTRNGVGFPSGVGFFAGGGTAGGELRQDVDVSAYASLIDRGIQRFYFSGWVELGNKTPADVGRVVLEYRDASNQNVLGQYDSGDITVKAVWQQVSSLGAAPVGTRWLRVRLLAQRTATSGNPDVYFDTFDLRSLGTPVFTIPDRSVTEGNAGTVTMTFPVTLSCAQTSAVTVDYATREAGAQEGLDYAPAAGTLTFQPGQTSLNIPVTVFGDTRTEWDEQFLVELKNSSGPVLLIPRGTGTILDDDRPASVALTGTLRDMKDTHPDFEKEEGGDPGIVQTLLGPDQKPVYASATRTITTHGKAAFDQWYRDVAGVNLAIPYTITLTPTAADPRIYSYSNLAFFPIDNQLFGNQGRNHNFHMTFEVHTRFLYGGHEVFRFYGDDDIWVFINGKLALDHGGVFLPYLDVVDLDAKAAELGIVPGGVYNFDIFWAERHTTGSSFQMETTLAFGATDPGVLQFSAPTYEVTENGAFATISVLRTRGDNGPVSVSYATANGTATAPADYTATSGTLSFRDGERGPKTFTIPITDDATLEPAETVNLTLTNPTGDAELGLATAVLTIKDDDAHPALAATKTAALAQDLNGDGQASPGDRLHYDIRITNTGTAQATGVALTDAVPANTHLVAGSVVASQGSVTGTGPVTVAAGSLAPGASASVSFDVTVDDPLPAGIASISNQGHVTADSLAEVLTDDPATPAPGDATVTPVTSKPDLAATKTAALAVDADGDGKPSPGDVLRYTVRIENRGSGPATAVTLDDPLPANTAAVAGSAVASQGTVDSESPLKVSLGNLPAGAVATVRFDVTIASPLPAGVREIRNQGMVASHELPTLPTDDPALGGAADPTVTAVTAAPMLVAEKTATLAVDADGDDMPSPGDTLEYLVTVRNRGNTSATGVIVDDPVPANTALVAGSVSASQGSIEAAPSARAVLGEIAGGGSATVRFRVQVAPVVPAGVREVSNQATVTSTELPPVPSDDPAAGGTADPTVTHLAAAPVLAVEKTALLMDDRDGDGVASPGDLLLYRITIANRGNTSATGVVLRDAVPENTAFEAGSLQVSQGTITSEQPVEAALGEIGAGTTATVTFRVTVDAGFPADRTEVSNQARVASAELPEAVSDDPGTPEAGDATRTPVFLTPSVVIDGATVAENGGSVQLPVRLSFASNREVRVDYATADGTATSGTDYTAANGTLIFASGETTKTITVPILDDSLDELDETFTVTLANPVHATLSGPQAVVTITDDDAAPIVSASSVSVGEGAGTATMSVTLSAPSGLEVRVDYATADGTAVAGSDYTAKSGTLIFPAGTTSQTISIPITNDALDEADETFQVHLANPVNATLGSSGTVTIADDDDPPAVSAANVSISESAGTATVSVTLSAPSGLEVKVDYATADGTAVAGSDYTAQSGTLIFPAGTTSQTVSIPITNDTLDEADETFEVGLSNPVNATLGSAATVTIEDDDESGLSIGDTRVTEGDQGTTDAIFAVHLTTPSSSEVRVDYATVAGTAREGVDYQAASGTLVFAPGETEKTVKVPVIGDRLLEADETFRVELSHATGAVIGDGSGLGTIVDDEVCAGPNLLLNPGAEQASAGAGAVPGWQAVTGSQWQTRGGTNPQPAAGSAYFYAGPVAHAELAQDVDVSAYARLIDGGGQAFAFSGAVRTLDEQPSDTARIVVEYRDEANAVVLDAFDTGEIASPLEWLTLADSRTVPVGTRWIRVRLLADRFQGSSDDGYFDALSLRSLRAPVLVIGDVAIPEGASGTRNAVFNVTLSCAVDGDVSVGYATADGTATAGSDYQAVSGSLTFPAGTTQRTIAVPVIGDPVTELDETFTVNLSGAQPADGVAVADPQGLGTILDDDATCALSAGYWKNHVSAWPVQSLVMGGRTYNASQMLTFLRYSGSDTSLHLARQLVATRLNLAAGSSLSIQPVVDAADAFLVTVPPGSNPHGAAGNQAEALQDQLEQYNVAECGSN